MGNYTVKETRTGGHLTTDKNVGHREFPSLQLHVCRLLTESGGGVGVTPYNSVYGEAPLERGTFFTLQVYERVGLSRVEVCERVRKSVI